jgi:hypothetical protein
MALVTRLLQMEEGIRCCSCDRLRQLRFSRRVKPHADRGKTGSADKVLEDQGSEPPPKAQQSRQSGGEQ